MADVRLVFKKEKSRIDDIELDALVSEQFSAEVDVTEHPVEKGANISDHARPRPETVTLEGVITNTPAPKTTDATTLRTQGDVTFKSRTESVDTEASARALSKMLALKDGGRLVDIVTGLRTYRSMLMTSLSIPRTAATGEALRFTAVFRQIRQVSSKSVTVTRTEPKTKAKKNLGNRPATNTTAPPQRRASLLRRAVD